MLSQQQMRVLILAVSLLAIVSHCLLLQQQQPTISIQANYFADPIVNIQSALTRPFYFKNLSRMEPYIWINYLLYIVLDCVIYWI